MKPNIMTKSSSLASYVTKSIYPKVFNKNNIESAYALLSKRVAEGAGRESIKGLLPGASIGSVLDGGREAVSQYMAPEQQQGFIDRLIGKKQESRFDIGKILGATARGGVVGAGFGAGFSGFRGGKHVFQDRLKNLKALSSVDIAPSVVNRVSEVGKEFAEGKINASSIWSKLKDIRKNVNPREAEVGFMNNTGGFSTPGVLNNLKALEFDSINAGTVLNPGVIMGLSIPKIRSGLVNAGIQNIRGEAPSSVIKNLTSEQKQRIDTLIESLVGKKKLQKGLAEPDLAKRKQMFSGVGRKFERYLKDLDDIGIEDKKELLGFPSRASFVKWTGAHPEVLENYFANKYIAGSKIRGVYDYANKNKGVDFSFNPASADPIPGIKFQGYPEVV